jgi:SNF2 family DNA or RNA helicase
MINSMNIQKPDFGVFLEYDDFNNLKLFPFDGRNKLSLSSDLIPNHMRYIFRKINSYGSMEQDLDKILYSEFSVDLLYYIMVTNSIKGFIWQEDMLFLTKINMNLVDDKVEISKGGSFVNRDLVQKHSILDSVSLSISNEDICFIGNKLVADNKTKKMGKIQTENGWGLWEFFKRCKEKDEAESAASLEKKRGLKTKKRFDWDEFEVNSVAFHTERFNKYGFEIDCKQSNDINFMIDNKKCKVNYLNSSNQYIVSITKDLNTNYLLISVKCIFNGQSFLLNEGLFNIFFLIDEEYKLLRLQDRIDFIREVIQELIQIEKPDDYEELINKALDNEVFSSLSVKQMARKYFEEFVQKLCQSHERIFIVDNCWNKVKTDLNLEANIYFEISKILENKIYSLEVKETQIRVHENLFYENIEKLQNVLKTIGIELFFEEKPVETVDLDFDIKTKRVGDVYNIYSEIFSGENDIEPKYWQIIIDNNGVMETDDKYQILSSKSRDILKAIITILPKQKLSKLNDLKKIVVPRLQIFLWLELRKMGVDFSLDPEEEQILQNILDFKKLDSYALPKGFNGTLREYQKSGYDWLTLLYNHCFGACLADDMGLGKTIQAIAFLGADKEGLLNTPKRYKKKPNLIVVPLSVFFNWKKELDKFYPGLKICEYIGAERKSDFGKFDIVLSTYDLLRRDFEVFQGHTFNIVIFDEAQLVKNKVAEKTLAVKRLNAYFRMCLTGTPLENHIGEFCNILDIVLPGLFVNTLDSQSDLNNIDKIDFVKRIAKPFVLRRTKTEILTDLPAKTENMAVLPFSQEQREVYKYYIEEVRKAIVDAYKNKLPQQANVIALTSILRLRQICLSPSLVDSSLDVNSPKLDFLIYTLKEINAAGHSALVFSHFKRFLDIVDTRLASEGFEYFRMDGGTTLKNRRKHVTDFQDSNEAKVFLLTLKTGGLGLNLTKASYVFHLDPWWNPAVERQAVDRVHRIGQDQKVFVQRLIMRDSIEERMLLIKEKKDKVFNAVLSSQNKKVGMPVLTREDFEYLLS